MRIDRLYRYPVKGLTAEALAETEVEAGGCLPWDRAFALAQGDAPFDPDNPQWLSNKAMVQMELLQPAESLSSLTAALALAPTNQLIRLNRAIVLLKAGDLDAARQEYEVSLQQAPHSVAALFGLEEIAWRQQNRKAAIGLCQQYLAISTAQSVEYTVVSNHLRTLQSPNSGN